MQFYFANDVTKHYLLILYWKLQIILQDNFERQTA
jgi:hypothetical protein